MLIDQRQSVVFISALFVGCVALPKPSKQEKPEDCIIGKQYWSTSFLNRKGTCAPCPHHWKNCGDQPIDDDKRCNDSCRVKSIIIHPSKSILSSPTPVFPTKPPPEHSKVLPNASIPSTVHSNKLREYEWFVILALLLALVFLLLVALVVLFRRLAGNQDGTSKNADEEMALQPSREPIDEQGSNGAQEPNDELEQNGAQEPNEEEEPNDKQELNDEQEPNGAQEPNDESEPNDGQDHLRPPVHATPSSRTILGVQEESKVKDTCSSTLNLSKDIDS